MRKFLILFLVSFAMGQVAPHRPPAPVDQQWTQLAPPQPTNNLYTAVESTANKRLPADKMNHLLNQHTYGIPAGVSNYGGNTLNGDAILQNTICVGAAGPNYVTCNSDFASQSPAFGGLPGAQDLDLPRFYTGAPNPVTGQNDPVYSACGYLETPNVCFIFHAPSNSYWTGGGRPAGVFDDEFFGFYDVTWNIVGNMYRYTNCQSGSCLGIGPCPTGIYLGTAASPCPIAGPSNSRAEQPGIDQDWNWTSMIRTATIGGVSKVGTQNIAFGGGEDNTPFFATGVIFMTNTELKQNQINHTIQGGYICSNSTGIGLFPMGDFLANFGACNPGLACVGGSNSRAACTTNAECNSGICNSEYECDYCVENGTLPFGSLVFCDYTDAQISAMGLSPIQANLLTQLCHYGSRIVNYGGSIGFGVTLINETSESGQGYYSQQGVQDPVYQYLNGQEIGSPLTPAPGYVGQLPIACGDDTGGLNSQYRCQANSGGHGFGPLYGIPMVTGPECATACSVLGHVHILDPNSDPVIATVGRNWTWPGGTLPAQSTGEIIISINGPYGSGTISSNPAGMDCDHVTWCAIGYALNTPITLTALPANGYVFLGWTGAAGCIGTNPFTLTTTAGAAQQCIATFSNTAIPHFLGIHLNHNSVGEGVPVPQVKFGSIRLFGCNQLQGSNGGCRWDSINQSSGSFDFTVIDNYLQELQSIGVTDAMVDLGNWTPAWALNLSGTCNVNAPCEIVNYSPPKEIAEGHCTTNNDNLNDCDKLFHGTNIDWRNYVAAFASHLFNNTRGVHVSGYELYNEFTREADYNNGSGPFSWLGTPQQLLRMAEEANCIIEGSITVVHATGETCATVRGTVTSVTLTGPIDPTAHMLLPSTNDFGCTGCSYVSNYNGYIHNGTFPGAPTAAADVMTLHTYAHSPGRVNGPLAEDTYNDFLTFYPQIYNDGKIFSMPVWSTEGNYGGWGNLNSLEMEAGYEYKYYLLLDSLGFKRIYMYGYDDNYCSSGQANGGEGCLYIANGQQWGGASGTYFTCNLSAGCLMQPGVAFQQMGTWLPYATFSTPCSANGTIWTCFLVTATGIQVQAVWDSSQSCVNGTPCPYPTTYPSSGSLNAKWHTAIDIYGNVAKITTTTIGIGYLPLFLQAN